MSSISENFDCPYVSSDITGVKCYIQKNKPQAVCFIRKKQKHMCQLKNLKDPLGLQGVNKIHRNHRRERLAPWKKIIRIFMTPRLKMDYYYHQKSTYLEQSNFQISGQKLDKKGIDPLQRGSLEEFEYSSLFSSKTYSILSYIVGGFVGSKSQMNNNKHNLSYDLSAVIFNLLNPCKHERDKAFFRKNTENNFCGAASKNYSDCYEKYFVNKSSHKEEKLKNCLDDVMNFKWLSALPLIDSESYIVPFNKPNDSVLNENESISCDEKDGLDNTAIKIIPCNSPAKVESKIIVHFNKEQTQCKSENDLSQNYLNSLPKDSTSVINNPSSLHCDHTDKLDTQITHIDSVCPSNPHSITSLVKERFRQHSECSVESTDSESFIVFDDLLDGEDEKKEEALDLDDDFDSEDEEESSCDEYDIYSVDNELEEINEKWFTNYQNDKQNDNEVKRKVKFSDNVVVNKIVAWDYAYRAARLGPWEQMARDRARFRERIIRLSSTISPILKQEHREKIYKKLYS